ncbi:hypothetical protein ACFOZ7_13200 [Natribaculum luteum]|uniref:Oligosaccharide repeat unit polymerase n=2 Tax=Natribaculum luteum TaxID=1586232 RepID=A0ABD5P1P2_9EURY
MTGGSVISPVLILVIIFGVYWIYFHIFTQKRLEKRLIKSVLYSALSLLLAATVVLFEGLAVWLAIIVVFSTFWNKLRSTQYTGDYPVIDANIEQEVFNFASKSIDNIKYLTTFLMVLCGFKIAITLISGDFIYYHNLLTLSRYLIKGLLIQKQYLIESIILYIWISLPQITSAILGVYSLQFWIVEMRRLNYYYSNNGKSAHVSLPLNMAPVLPVSYMGFWIGLQIPSGPYNPYLIVRKLYSTTQIIQFVEVFLWLIISIFPIHAIYWRIKPFVDEFRGGRSRIRRERDSESYNYNYMVFGFVIQIVVVVLLQFFYPSQPFSIIFGKQGNLILLILVPLTILSTTITSLLSKNIFSPLIFWTLSMIFLYYYSIRFGNSIGAVFVFLSVTFISIYSLDKYIDEGCMTNTPM